MSILRAWPQQNRAAQSLISLAAAIGMRSWLEMEALPAFTDDEYERIEAATAALLLREVEMRHQAYLTIATAADARAAQIIVGAIAAAAGSLALAGGVWAAEPSLATAAALGGLVFLLAGGFAGWACRPQPDYAPPGILPDERWSPSFLANSTDTLALSRVRALHSILPDQNAALQRRARWASLALNTALAAPIYAFAAWLVS